MIGRMAEKALVDAPKSVLLLGPRQVGKSTLVRSLKPDVEIQLADEENYQAYLKDPGRLKRIVAAHDGPLVIFIDEVQRIPSLLNSVQAIVDRDPQKKFFLTGSSARKLKRGQANLLPGRITVEYLTPLLYWEVKDRWDLDRALSVGMLPEIYLESYGPDLLSSYASLYLKEEIQAEALTRNIRNYSRFLDVAAELSGHYINYAKLATDAEVNKETIRRYMDILADTLLIEKIASFTDTTQARKARQKERFLFFDVGVRNALLQRHRAPLSKEEKGALFEQWLIVQLIGFQRTQHKPWIISSYRDHAGLEVDLLLETPSDFLAVEIKSNIRAHARMFKNLSRFERLIKRDLKKIVVFQGEHIEKFEDLGLAMPYQVFLDMIESL